MAPLILFGTNDFGTTPSLDGLALEQRGCFIFDRSRLREADAVVFHIPEFSWPWGGLEDTPKFSGQLWIAWSRESNVNYPRLSDREFMCHFELRMTYERNADVWIPYLPKYSTWISAQSSLMPEKTEQCPTVLFQSDPLDMSGRNAYIAELMRHTRVDSYGRFLKNRMLAGPDLGRLTKLAVISRYHFCLAFENSIAPDYVTEKIFQPLLAGTIPIYRGAPNFQQFVPEGSFINADAYNGPNDLADYLHHLLESPKEYEAYFAWRRKPLPTFLLEAISSLDSHHLLRLQSVVEQRIGNRQRRHFGFPSYPFGLSAVVKARTRKWRCASVPAPTNLMQPAMAADADDHVMYGYGWCWSEPTGRWTNGPLAWLWIQRPPGREGSLLRVAGHMIARPDEPQVVDIWSGWRRLGRLSWPAGVRSVATIRLPSALHRRDVLTLIFRIQKPIAPADIGIGEDSRQLGLFLEGIRSSPCMRDAAATPIHLHIHKGSGDLGILWSGWSAPEPTGCWTDGPDAVLQWTSPRELPADARRIIQGVGFAPGGQPPRGSVFINGRRAGDLDRLHWKCGAADLSMPIGAPLMRREITVHIQLDNPRSPRELGISSDERKLGLFVQSLHIEIDHHTESSHSKKLPAGSA